MRGRAGARTRGGHGVTGRGARASGGARSRTASASGDASASEDGGGGSRGSSREAAPGAPPGRALVWTSSYGVSALVHLGFVLIALFVVLARVDPPASEREVRASLEAKEPRHDPERPRDLFRKERVPLPTEVPHPLAQLDDEKPDAVEIPRGTSLTNPADKQLDADSISDALGPTGMAAGAYGERSGKPGLVPGGGGPETEEAVAGALAWLARHQDPDGRWSASGFHARCAPGRAACRGPDLRARGGVGPGEGDARYDTGVTALALLAFLGHGHTHRHSPHPAFARVVRAGLAHLRAAQAPDGAVGFADGEDIYNHVIATLALCEAYDVSRDFQLKAPAQRAVDWLVRAQNPGLGWKYGARTGKNDTSVTGWAVLALKAARHARLEVPEAAFEGALAWIERATADGGRGRPPGLVGYERPGDGGSMLDRRALDHPEGYPAFEGAPTMTAVAVLCRVFAGQRRDHERVRQGVAILAARPPRWDPPAVRSGNQTSFYYWYYGTYGLFQATRIDAKAWTTWNRAMREALLGPDGRRPRTGAADCAEGSWDPVDEWGIPGGRVYATAMNALTLEIYYRYVKVEEAIEGRSPPPGRRG